MSELDRLVEALPARYRSLSAKEWKKLFTELSKARWGQNHRKDAELRKWLAPILFAMRHDYDPLIDEVIYERWIACVVRYLAPLDALHWPQKWTIGEVRRVLSGKTDRLADLLFGDERDFRQALIAVVTTREYQSRLDLSDDQKHLIDCIQKSVTDSPDFKSLISDWTEHQLEDLVRVLNSPPVDQEVSSVPPKAFLVARAAFKRPYAPQLFTVLILIVLFSTSQLASSWVILPSSFVVLTKILLIISLLGFASLYGYSFWQDRRTSDDSEV